MANTVKNDDQIDKNSAPAGGRPQGPTQKRVRRQRAQRARRVRLMAMVVLIFALTLAASGMYVNQYDLLPGHTNFVEWWQQQFLDSARMAPVLPTTTAVVVGWSQDTPTPAAGPATPPPVNGQEVRLADGLRYVDVQVGAGREVTVARRIDVEYTVWLKS
ncbi:MAG TPA: hypothetical protein VKR06_27230, partial [Ktedonosporobacter sp.]|nr:hypothetical protein [Ktedonosporobacter sp.]